MAVSDGRLYVAVLNTVAVIDTATGDVLDTYTAPDGADHLNDVIFDPSSDKVYVSDSSENVIYKVDAAGIFSVFYEEEKRSPYQSGLYLDGDRTAIASNPSALAI